MTPPYTVRPVRAHEWRDVKALRLEALSDEAAPVAFLQTYATAAAYSDEFWEDRSHGSSVDAGPHAEARQFVAIADDGRWVGTAVALVENAGGVDFEGAVIDESGGHLVGVYVAPEHRGRGVLASLFEAATGWLRDRGLASARLYVHADNVRAQRAYEKSGFRATGKRVTGTIGPEIEMGMSLTSEGAAGGPRPPHPSQARGEPPDRA